MTIGSPKYHIPLSSDEEALIRELDLRVDIPLSEDAHQIFLNNSRRIPRLLKSLGERSAIPRHRLDYWRSPEISHGRVKGSLEQIFARNGSRGLDAYTNPHFIPVLNYFLFGADLPEKAIEEFEEQIGDRRGFSGSDILALNKKTKELMQRFGLSRTRAEEFFKLALDCELGKFNAASVRKAAREATR